MNNELWKKTKYTFWVFVVVIIHYSLFIIPVFATTNIDSINKWAWNDIIGWIDFYGANSVMVKGNKIEGYASSPIGYISFDCATGPPGSNCSVLYSVVNDFNGNLSGWAWSENIGWISFNCSDAGVCGASNYKVTINPTTGDFSGWAWNDSVGWISFNCVNVVGSCATSNYKVRTTVGSNPSTASLISSIFDGGTDDGVTLNSIMWKGALNGGIVQFQIASSNSSSGTWVFVGPDGAITSFYQPNQDVFTELKGHINKRYYRYKIILKTDNWQTFSPKVDDVIINYSP